MCTVAYFVSATCAQMSLHTHTLTHTNTPNPSVGCSLSGSINTKCSQCASSGLPCGRILVRAIWVLLCLPACVFVSMLVQKLVGRMCLPEYFSCACARSDLISFSSEAVTCECNNIGVRNDIRVQRRFRENANMFACAYSICVNILHSTYAAKCSDSLNEYNHTHSTLLRM